MTESFQNENQSLSKIYEQKVRTIRTRSCELDIPERENDAQIQHTLLGIELKVGRRRFACPDLATARYMRVFARIGCRSFAIPYDITKISTIADELETAWQHALLCLDNQSRDQTDRQRSSTRSKFVKSVRQEINAIGPGDKMPEFNQSTKQRKP